MFWAALHRLITLARGGRLRPEYDSDRVELLATQFAVATYLFCNAYTHVGVVGAPVFALVVAGPVQHGQMTF